MKKSSIIFVAVALIFCFTLPSAFAFGYNPCPTTITQTQLQASTYASGNTYSSGGGGLALTASGVTSQASSTPCGVNTSTVGGSTTFTLGQANGGSYYNGSAYGSRSVINLNFRR